MLPGCPRRGWLRLLFASLALAIGLFGNARSARTDEISAPGSAGIAGTSWTVERFVDYPFKTQADLARVHNAAAALRTRLPSDGRQAASGIDALLYELEAFTSPAQARGETVSIVSFSSSPDRALATLRDRVKLPAPPGGAVVRLYSSREDMPGPIRSLFGQDTAGVTHWRRYIAVLKEERSQKEIADIVSHELVHAYLLTLLGPDGDRLPKWFHEGAALYLSGGRTQYVSVSDFGRERVSYSPRDYNEFRLAFRYIAETFGRDAVNTFIREAVRQRSVSRPLLAATGASDYSVLRQDAWAWHRRKSVLRALAVLAGAGLIGLVIWLLSRRRAARAERAMALIEEARMLARVGLREEALENLEQAKRLEPYLARVRMAIQQAEDEVFRVNR